MELSLAGFIADLRFAVRRFRRTPAIGAGVVLTLALGIAATTVIFSVVYGVLLRPLPFRDADRLVVVAMERSVAGTHRPVRAFFPAGDLPTLQRAVPAFESLGLYSQEHVVLSWNGFSEPLESASVSPEFFATAGGRLESGRALGPPDEGRQAIVISGRLRQRLFGVERAEGRPLRIGGDSYEIVGVAHRTFQLPASSVDVWMPARDAACCPYAVLGRLKSNTSAAEALAQIGVVLPQLARQNPRVYEGAGATIGSVREELVGNLETTLWVLFAAGVLLLLSACANAANLLFTFSQGRAREIAVRIAVGASRGHLVRQALAETTVAVGTAAVLALVVSVVGLDALLATGAAGFPLVNADAVRVDAPVLGFALACAGVATALVGVLPVAMRRPWSSSIDAPTTTAGLSRRRLRDALVIVQLAVAVVLVVGASLLGRSLTRLLTTDMGVAVDRVAVAAINLSYQRRLSDGRQRELLDAVVARIRALPGVRAAGAGAGLPPSSSTIRLTLKRAGDAVDYQAAAVAATPGYFPALGMQLLQGRLFSDADVDSRQQVMIMTADTARRFFGGNPIGRSMTLPILRDGVAGSVEVTLVGVIANVKHSGLEAAPDDAVYRPIGQQAWPTLFVVARGDGDPRALAAALRREISAVDRAIAIASADALEDVVAREAARPRFRSAVLAALAVFTLSIAAVGLYALIDYTVSQRTKEIGIRVALGATPSDLRRLVLAKAAALALCGVAAGTGAALAAARLAARLLYGIAPTDAVSFTAAIGGVLLVAAAAASVPAGRAARLDPLVALRRE